MQPSLKQMRATAKQRKWAFGLFAMLAALAMLPFFSTGASIFPQQQQNAQDDSALCITEETLALLQDEAMIDVIVWLQDNDYTGPGYQQDLQRKEQEITNMQQAVLATLPREEFTLKYRYRTVNGFAGAATKQALQKLLENPAVTAMFRDPLLSTMLTESRQLTNAFDAEFLGASGAGHTACVVDTGVDYTHSALGGCLGASCKVLGGYDFINNDPDPLDDDGHGTHVAGIIASNHQTYRGIAPDANLVAVKVCYPGAGGTCPGSAIIAGVDWCTANKATYNIDVVSISLTDQGNYPGAGSCPSWMDTSVNNAYSAGIFVDAASGNNGYTTGISYPACSPNVVSVGATYDVSIGQATWCTNSGCTQTCTDATTQADQIVCFTNRASSLDILAPGAVIKSTASAIGTSCGAPLGNFQSCSGTSMAAPMVAGAALQLREENPALTPAQIESTLKNSGTYIFDAASGQNLAKLDATSGLVCQ